MDQLKVDPKILEKIQKLMAMANDKGATQGEIENATKMAQQHLLKYNLSMTDIDAHVTDEEKEQGVHRERIDYSDTWKKVEGNWIAHLYHNVAIHNMCMVITHSAPTKGGKGSSKVTALSLIGKPHNVNIVNYLCMQLIPQIRRAEATAWNYYRGYEKRGRYRRGFLMGCVDGIHIQLKQQEEALRAAENKINAMIVVNDHAIKDYVSQEFGKLSQGRASNSSSWDGRIQGKITGKNMGLRQGISGSTRSSSKSSTGLLN